MTRTDKSKRPSRNPSSRPLPKTASPKARTSPTNPEPQADAHEKLAKIAGLPAVSALFRQDPQRVMRLYYEASMKNAVGSFCAELARLHRPYRLVTADELTKIAGSVLHGGIVAAALPRPLPDFDLVAAERWARAGESLVILDGVGNPHNLGAIARTLAFFDFRHLAISDHPQQAAPSDAAYRVAEGGLDVIDVHRIRQLPRMLKRLQSFYCVVGTALTDTATALEELALDHRPLALVLGNEEQGVPQLTLQACEAVVMIPGAGSVQSLNVSATASILAYALSRRQRPGPRGSATRRAPVPGRRR